MSGVRVCAHCRDPKKGLLAVNIFRPSACEICGVTTKLFLQEDSRKRNPMKELCGGLQYELAEAREAQTRLEQSQAAQVKVRAGETLSEEEAEAFKSYLARKARQQQALYTLGAALLRFLGGT